jgi:type VI secretion system secreted protein VgrG
MSIFTLAIEGSETEWLVQEMLGREAIHEPFRFEVLARSVSSEGDADFAKKLVTRKATLELPLETGDSRVVHAIVEMVEQTEAGCRIVLVPRAAAARDAVDHQVFLGLDAAAIAAEVLAKHDVTLTNRCTRTLPKRAQCVQAFESDLDFVSRILAEEGVAWFCDPEAADTLIAADAPSGFPAVEGDPWPIRHDAGLETTKPSVHRARLRRRVATSKVTLRDYSFEAPSIDLTADAKQGDGRLERYEYRGHYTDPSLGATLAQIRLDAYRAATMVLTAETTCRALAAGKVVTLAEGPIGAMDGEWLIVTVEHSGRDSETGSDDRIYHARFTAVPRADGYRPLRRASPKLGGVQTADVTGPPGQEIHTDQHARIRAHFRWDRRRPKDDTASFWLRTVQPPTSGGVFLPRVGWETIVSFWGTSADNPFEIGRLYNGVASPPSSLPAKKICSAFGTLTTPGGGSANLVQFDDTAGNEGMTFNASRDFNERTTNDKTTSITADDSHTVGANRKVLVGQVHAVEVKGAQTYSVGATRTVNVNANKIIKAGSETVAIGGARIFDVGGDQSTTSASLMRAVGAAKLETCIEHQSILVTGSSARSIGASFTQLAGVSAALSVGGINKEEVGGAKTIKALKYGLSVRGALTETYASRTVSAADINDAYSAAATLQVGGSATMTGADVIVSATSKLVVKAGGMTITITPGAVKIDGKFDSSQGAKDKNSEDYD